MTRLLLLYSLVWPLGQLLILPGTDLAHIYALDLLHLLLSACLLISPRFRRDLFHHPLTPSLTLFLLALLLSIFFSTHLPTPSAYLFALAYFLRLAAPASVFFAVRYLHPGLARRLLFLMLAIFIILSAVQYLVSPDMRFISYLGFDDHYYRLIGSLLDPNYTGLILTFAALYLLSLTKKTSILAVISLALLAATFSRSSYLAFAVGLLASYPPRSLFKKALPVLIVVALAIILLPKPFGEGVNLWRTFSIYSRLGSMSAALSLWWSSPLFGVGLGALKYASSSLYQQRSSLVDNSFLFILASSGVVGLAAFINYLYRLVFELKSRRLLIAVFAALLIHSLFNNSFFYLWSISLFYFLLGLYSATGRKPASS